MRKFENIRLKIRLLIIFLALVTGMSSCTQNLDGYDWSIGQDSENPVIDNSVGDIKFKFCLLNKDSVPATVFKQGENIYFYFDIMNVSEELITVNELDILEEEDVFMVYFAGTNVQAGKPWYTKGCRYVNIIGRMEIPINNSYGIILPWSFIFGEIIICPLRRFCCCEQEFLPSGEYTCRFKTDFTYKKNEKEEKLKGLSFKIKFEIIES